MITSESPVSLMAPALARLGKHSCIFGLALALVGCMGWAPGRKAYWDEQVRQMCKKDGGVEIFERMRVAAADLQFLGTIDGKIDVPIRQLADPRAPAYSVNEVTVIRQQDPLVRRSVWNIVRRSDEKIVARWIVYSRIGGDFPSPSHESQFICPDLKDITSKLQRLFIVEGVPK